MGNESFLPILWRRKWIVIGTVLVFALTAGVLSKILPKAYETSAELLIVQNGQAQGFDAVQAAQVSARTYGNIITSPNIAELVARETNGQYTRQELEGKVKADPVPETQLLRITLTDGDPAEAKRLTDLYTRVFVDYVRTRLSRQTRVSISIADAAAVPDGPVRPKPRLYIPIAMIIGLAIGIALAVLRDRLDSRLRSLAQVESEFDLPVLARLPRRGSSDDDHFAFTESFRLMRTNLQFMRLERPLQALSFTSVDAGEGKSTTVANLALAIASSGGEALAVEADVRRPSLQGFFAPDEREPLQPGLTTFIIGTATLDEVIHRTRYPSVELLPAGPAVPSLSGLLQSERGREVIDRIVEHGPLALFDLPPLNAGADATTLAARTDGVILVVDLETATRAGVREALRQLDAVHANVLGFVLNRDRSLRRTSYGYGIEADGSSTAQARASSGALSRTGRGRG